MKRVSASDAKNRFGGLLEEAAMSGRVDIVRHGRVVGVLLSPRAFDELSRAARSAEPEKSAPAHMLSRSDIRKARVIRQPRGFDDE